MRLPLTCIRDVAERQLCCGCGVCAYLSPDEIEMVDTLEYGRRPLLRDGVARDPRSAEALQACPGIGLRRTLDWHDTDLIAELKSDWGPVREVWEGYAADPAIRFAGSSGGAASALAIHCIERAGMHGLLHVAARLDAPWLNHTVLSTTRAQILARTGSRYSPASPCDRLDRIEHAPARCVFLGKPCDVAAAVHAGRVRHELDERIGLIIAIFCAGTPTTQGTFTLLSRMGVANPAALLSLRYRGNGWPGRTVVRVSTPNGVQERALPYEEAWGEVLSKHKQWRCNLCPDHTGELADIAVGDPWYRPATTEEPGRSLILVRSERGKQLLHAAIDAGCLVLQRAAPAILPASQPNLLRARGAVWGRVFALRLMGILGPSFQEMDLFRCWVETLNWREKAASILGVFRRVFTRRLRTVQSVTPHNMPHTVTAGKTAQAPAAVYRPDEGVAGMCAQGTWRGANQFDGSAAK